MQNTAESRAVLLTGGAGYIGSHIAVELAASGRPAVIVDNLCNSSEEALRGIAEITGVEPVFYRTDARDKDAMREIVKNTTSPRLFTLPDLNRWLNRCQTRLNITKSTSAQH